LKGFMVKPMNNTPNQITICTAASPDWLEYVHIQLYSILKNNTSNSFIKYYILTDTDSVTEEHLNLFRKLFCLYEGMFDVQFIDIEESFNRLVASQNNVSERYKRHALYRLFIPQCLTEDKVLYLDSDTIVCQDLSKLFSLDMKDWYVAGVMDTGIMPDHKKNIGMSENVDYFNSGVLIFNNKLIIEDNLFDEMLKLCNGEPLLGLDQDIINLVLSENSTELNPRYNVSLSTVADIPQEHTAILHHAGKKPWDTDEAFRADVWKEYYNECF